MIFDLPDKNQILGVQYWTQDLYNWVLCCYFSGNWTLAKKEGCRNIHLQNPSHFLASLTFVASNSEITRTEVRGLVFHMVLQETEFTGKSKKIIS